MGGPWRHGCYHRKADRSAGGESRNPVAVLRFLCRECLRTCSRLPACIAPRRWYDWAVQQVVLMILLGGGVVHGCSRCAGRARRTMRRWRDWRDARGERFAFFLRSRFAELGRIADHASFWRHVLDSRAGSDRAPSALSVPKRSPAASTPSPSPETSVTLQVAPLRGVAT
jgi:hypothetical protein